MSITIPEHVKQILTSINKTQHVDNMPFKLLTTSDDSIYLWFLDCGVGFIVQENEWNYLTMAQASVRFDKNHSIPFQLLPLDCIGCKDVKIYPDYSMSWVSAGNLMSKLPSECKSQLNEWITLLDAKSKSLKSKLLLQSNGFNKMSASLKKLVDSLS